MDGKSCFGQFWSILSYLIQAPSVVVMVWLRFSSCIILTFFNFFYFLFLVLVRDSFLSKLLLVNSASDILKTLILITPNFR